MVCSGWEITLGGENQISTLAGFYNIFAELVVKLRKKTENVWKVALRIA